MKKILVAAVVFALFLTGCSFCRSQQNINDAEKRSRIEVYSLSDDKLLKTIDDQETVDTLLEMHNWEEVEKPSDDIVPEYKLLVYQEKTLLFGQDPAGKRDYELIGTIITFQNSPYIKEVISSDVIKNMTVPEGAMTFYYAAPDDTIKEWLELLTD